MYASYGGGVRKRWGFSATLFLLGITEVEVKRVG